MDACPLRLADRLRWCEGWRAAQREIDTLIARHIEAARMGRETGR